MNTSSYTPRSKNIEFANCNTIILIKIAYNCKLVCLFIMLNTMNLEYDSLKKDMIQEMRFEPRKFQWRG